jgi:hypothetical protein
MWLRDRPIEHRNVGPILFTGVSDIHHFSERRLQPVTSMKKLAAQGTNSRHRERIFGSASRHGRASRAD